MASNEVPSVYVERIGSDRYRWSLIHSGGCYPLMRVSARFLKVDYRTLLIGFRKVLDGYSALAKHPNLELVPDACTLVTFDDGPVSADEAADLISGALG
jgi:hypothetical protein